VALLKRILLSSFNTLHGAQDQVGLQLQNSSELEVFDLHGYCLGLKHDLGLHFVVLQTLLTAYLTAYCLTGFQLTAVSHKEVF